MWRFTSSRNAASDFSSAYCRRSSRSSIIRMCSLVAAKHKSAQEFGHEGGPVQKPLLVVRCPNGLALLILRRAARWVVHSGRDIQCPSEMHTAHEVSGPPTAVYLPPSFAVS